MLNKINFYQFDNLINNRVPFVFLNLHADISGWYTSIHKTHLLGQQVLIQEDGILSHLNQSKAAKDMAIVLMCFDGSKSLQWYEKLQKLSYTNVYVVDGGHQQMVTERSEV